MKNIEKIEMIKSYGIGLSCFDMYIETEDNELLEKIEKLVLDNIEKIEMYEDTTTHQAVESALYSSYMDK